MSNDEQSYHIYGVGNDEIIIKLRDILDQAQVEYEFFDFKDFPPTNEQLEKWAEHEGCEFAINEKSSLFKKNKKHWNKANYDQRLEFIQKNYRLIVKPIIEDEHGEIISIGGRPERLAKKVFGLEKC